MHNHTSLLAIYPSHTAAEAAVVALQHSGFEMSRLSIYGCGHSAGACLVSRDKTGWLASHGRTGAILSGLGGLVFGSAIFWMSRSGPPLASGSPLSWIIGSLGGVITAGGLIVIGASLCVLFIPRDGRLRYETAHWTDKFILIAHGSLHDTAHAKEILHHISPGPLEHLR